MLLTPFAADAQDDLTQNFVKAYEAKYNLTPNQFAADSYDAIYAIKAAAEKANLTPDMSVSDICDKMKEAMSCYQGRQVRIRTVIHTDCSNHSGRNGIIVPPFCCFYGILQGERA